MILPTDDLPRTLRTNMKDVIAQIRHEVKSIVPFDETEAAHAADALAWVESGIGLFRVAKPDKPPKHLVSYFVLIDPTRRSMLLGDHIKAQLWLPSGGHVEPGEHPRQTVIREAREELAREAAFLHGNDKPLFVTVTRTVGLTAGHTDVSLWYLLQGEVHEQLFFDHSEFNDMAWFSFDRILDSNPAIFDPHLQRFTCKLMQALD